MKRKLNRGILLWSLCISLSGVTIGQDSSVLGGKDWILYSVPGKTGMRLPFDSLKNLPGIPLENITMKEFLQGAIMWPVGKYGLWMGAFTASVASEDGERRKILISSYGGFFLDDRAKKYYEIAEEKRKAWYDYLNASVEKLQLK